MGIVHYGIDKATRMPVAIKQVKASRANLKILRECARLESSIQYAHPNLVEMLGYVEQPGTDAIFIISRFIKGENSDQYVQREFPDLKKRVIHVAHIMGEVANALDFIHSKNIVHLDIKPSNIMIEKGCNIRLMDLGIARGNTVQHMSGGGIMGTSGFCAPEQHVSPDKPVLDVDHRTDIYGMAATFYYLMAGKCPDSKPDFKKNGIGKKLARELKKAMNPDRNKRHGSALEFANACKTAAKRDSKPGLFARLFR